MVLPASTAASLTAIAITTSDDEKVNREITLAENQIRAAVRKGVYAKVFNAQIIGNPIADPDDDDHLTPNQIAFRNAFLSASYEVSLDSDTGYWRFDWEPA